jgi:hypothetical protein
MTRPKARIEHGVLSKDDIHELRTYLYQDQTQTGTYQLDTLVKKPVWSSTGWPREIIERALNRLFGNDYGVMNVDFFQTTGHVANIHVDSRGRIDAPVPNVLFCLWFEPEAQTLFFDNYWNQGFEADFTRKPWNRWQHRIYSQGDKWIEIADIRELLWQCENDPANAPITVTAGLIEKLRALVKRRQMQRVPPSERTEEYHAPLDRINDYSLIENYQPGQTFDRTILRRYVNHLDPEDFDGLVLDKVIDWQVGSAIIFDRTQLHVPTCRHWAKSAVSVWTKPKIGYIHE